MSDKLKTALTGKTLPKHPPKQIRLLTELDSGDVVLVAYAAAPARLPGTFGAEVVSVAKDGKFASIKLLIPEKLPVSVVLKQLAGKIVDAADDRMVTVSFPPPEVEKQLKELKQSLVRFSLDRTAPALGEIMAFVYPESPEEKWDPGVMIGSLMAVAKKPDANGSLRYRALFYYAIELEENPEEAMEEIPFLRGSTGIWTDEKYGAHLVMVRRATPGEVRQYENDRNEVARHRSLPNAKPPKKETGKGKKERLA
jgi:hypothetical protein